MIHFFLVSDVNLTCPINNLIYETFKCSIFVPYFNVTEALLDFGDGDLRQMNLTNSFTEFTKFFSTDSIQNLRISLPEFNYTSALTIFSNNNLNNKKF